MMCVVVLACRVVLTCVVCCVHGVDVWCIDVLCGVCGVLRCVFISVSVLMCGVSVCEDDDDVCVVLVCVSC